jgi:hypothetical protein
VTDDGRTFEPHDHVVRDVRHRWRPDDIVVGQAVDAGGCGLNPTLRLQEPMALALGQGETLHLQHRQFDDFRRGAAAAFHVDDPEPVRV